MFTKRTNREAGAGNDAPRELQRLSRQDLLELLLNQTREGDRLHQQLERDEKDLADLADLVECLKGHLNDKNDQIRRLKTKLDDKDSLIEQLFLHAREIVRGRGRATKAFHKMESLLAEHYFSYVTSKETGEPGEQGEAHHMRPDVAPTPTEAVTS